MINVSLSIVNPYKNSYRHLFVRAGGTPFRNKFWEFEVLSTPEIVALMLRVSARCNHAGFELGLGFLGYGVRFQWYDNRHWDYAHGTYQEWRYE